jgi:hypothetical protein
MQFRTHAAQASTKDWKAAHVVERRAFPDFAEKQAEIMQISSRQQVQCGAAGPIEVHSRELAIMVSDGPPQPMNHVCSGSEGRTAPGIMTVV